MYVHKNKMSERTPAEAPTKGPLIFIILGMSKLVNINVMAPNKIPSKYSFEARRG